MAVGFAYRIHALTGFDADAGTASETGQYYRDMTAQWMTDALKEVVNILPPPLFDRCAKVSAAQVDFTNGTGVANEQKIIGALRSISTAFNAGEVYTCRPISHLQSYKAADPDHVDFATQTDPVVYFEPQVDGTAVKVRILPTSSLAVAKIITVDYPVFTASDSGTYDVVNATSIANFPDEAEELVVLRAAIYAAQYQLSIEEDEDLYEPIIETLEKRYKQAVDSLQTKKIEAAPSKSKGMDIGKVLQSLGKGKK